VIGDSLTDPWRVNATAIACRTGACCMMVGMRPRVVVHNVASMDGRLTLAPGLDLMAGDERWTVMTADLPDPYAWARTTYDPQVFLEGSGSFLNPVAGALQGVELAPAPEGVHFLPDDIVGVPGRRWFAVVDGAGVVDLQFTEWPDAAWAGWHSMVLTTVSTPRRSPSSSSERPRATRRSPTTR